MDENPLDVAVLKGTVDGYDTTCNILINANLENEQRLDMTDVCEQFMSTLMDTGRTEPAKVPPMTLRFKPGRSPTEWGPEVVRSRVARNVLPFTQQMTDDFVNRKILVLSQSAWNAPVVMIRKHGWTVTNQAWRFCVSYKRLNARIDDTCYPLTTVMDALSGLKGSQYFTTLDLKHGYLQLPLDERSREFTAFSVQGRGSYMWTRCPMGLKTSARHFVKTVEGVLKHAGLGEKVCAVYVDDIIVYGATWQDHTRNVRAVLAALQSAGLWVNGSKCKFGMTMVSYVGVRVTPEGFSMTNARVRDLLSTESPKNAAELRTFQGVIAAYQRWLPPGKGHLERLAAIYQYAGKSAPPWDQDAIDRCFEHWKQLIVDHGLVRLGFIDSNAKLVLRTDASNVGCGAVIHQVVLVDNPDNPGQQVPMLRPIDHYSHRFNATEKVWNTTEKEAFAVVKALRRFRYYLFNTYFLIEVDHKNLVSFKGLGDSINAKLQRWSIELGEYSYEMRHIAGTKNVIADWLSRQPAPVDVPGAAGPIGGEPPSAKAHMRLLRASTAATNVQPGDTIVIDRHCKYALQDYWGFDMRELDDHNRSLPAATAVARARRRRQDSGVVETKEAAVDGAPPGMVPYVPLEKSPVVSDDPFGPKEYEQWVDEHDEYAQMKCDDECWIVCNSLLTAGEATKYQRSNLFEQQPNGLWMRRENAGVAPSMVVLPRHEELDQLKKKLVREAHATCHGAVELTYNRIKASGLWWPSMYSFVKMWVNRCLRCNRLRAHQSAKIALQQKVATVRQHTLSIDEVGPINPVGAGGERYVLTVVDKFSRWLWLIPMKSKSASEMWQALKSRVFDQGYPKILLCDAGSGFASADFGQKCRQRGIDLQATPVGEPAVHAERFVQEWKKLLKKVWTNNWVDELPGVALALNSRRNGVTGMTPASLHRGGELNLGVPSADWLSHSAEVNKPVEAAIAAESVRGSRVSGRIRGSTDRRDVDRVTVEQLTEALCKATEQAVDNQTRANERIALRADSHNTLVKFELGDWVLYPENPIMATGLYTKWSGPWEVMQQSTTTVELRHIHDPRLLHNNVAKRQVFCIDDVLLDESHLHDGDDNMPDWMCADLAEVQWPIQRVMDIQMRDGVEYCLVKWNGHSVMTWQSVSSTAGKPPDEVSACRERMGLVTTACVTGSRVMLVNDPTDERSATQRNRAERRRRARKKRPRKRLRKEDPGHE